jgi:hypothetical protein
LYSARLCRRLLRTRPLGADLQQELIGFAEIAARNGERSGVVTLADADRQPDKPETGLTAREQTPHAPCFGGLKH